MKSVAAARWLGVRIVEIWRRVPVRTKVVALLVVVVLAISAVSTSQTLHDIHGLRGGNEPSVALPAEGNQDGTADKKKAADTADTKESKNKTGENEGRKSSEQPKADPESLWRDATGGTQPDLAGMTDLSIEVDLAAQRVYVRSDGRDVYVMTVSTGVDDTTPRGDFTISGRGDHFYNPDEGMGGDLWVNFLDNVYLFHTVPTRQNAGDYIPEEGAKLGKPASHGCVRLSLADARWFYDQIPDGTPVHIG